MNRWHAAWEALALEGRARKAEQRERQALASAGPKVFEALRGHLDNAGSPARVQSVCDQLKRIDARVTALQVSLDHSLAKDRDDFARASQAMRWLVVGRGVLDRVLLRGDVRRETRARPSLYRTLGGFAFDGPHAELIKLIPEQLANDIASARADAAGARAERAKLLEPYAGEPLPGWLVTTLRETRILLEFIWDQLAKKFFLRAPALAGLLVGWWIGRQFSDSVTATWVHDHIGLDIRERSEVASQQQLTFWLPLLAAALCSYIASFVALRVQRKYALPGASASQSKSPSV